jgi:acetyltransferase-like isoleucine patch superfamily enzyme
LIRSRVPFLRLERGLPRGVTVGRHTYGYDKHTFQMFTEGSRIVVGAFCSFGPEVRVLGGGEHVTTRASSFPLNALLFDRAKRNALDDRDKGPTVIGNDVWIGFGATILTGVSVGDGAVIGARALVSRPVPAYAVVVGSPARIVRYRFCREIQNRLLALRWWEWDDKDIRRLEPWFMSDVEVFLEEMEQIGAPAPQV